MKLANITKEDIWHIADSSRILERGRRYYRTGKIKSMKVVDDVIKARVKGNYGTYNVEIDIDDDGEIDAYCDCPYDGDGCKHIVAVLYKWIDQLQTDCLVGIKKASKKKNKKRGLYNITFNDISKKTSNEFLVKAFDIVKANNVKINLLDHGQIIAKVIDHNKKETVVIEASRNHLGVSSFNRCTCTMGYGFQNCPHTAAVLLTILKQQNKKLPFSKYEKNIRTQLNNEKFTNFVDELEAIQPEETLNKNQYHFLFWITKKRNGISIQVLKAIIRKSGTLGRTSSVSEKLIKNHYDTFSKTKKRAFELFMFSLKTQYGYYSYSNNKKLIKDTFEKNIDIELISCLRDVYKEDPNCFSNCSFPDEKAYTEINIKQNHEDNNFIFRITAKLNEKSFCLDGDDIFIMGKKPLWICSYDKEEDKYLLFELNTKHPELVSYLIKYSGIQVNSAYLKDFIEKFYLKLSSLGIVNLPKNYDVEEKIIEPKPRIFLMDYGKLFRIELRFLYNTHEVKYGSSHDIIVKDKKDKIIKIKRNRDKEKKYYSTLLENHTIEKNDILTPSICPYAWLVDIAKNLISLGYEIYGIDKLFNQKINFKEPELAIEVSSGIDWFDLKAEASFGDEKVSFDKIIQALSSHERFVKLSDGSMGIIPKKWLNKLSGVAGLLEYDKKQEKTKASNSQIAIIESLLDIANKSKVDKQFKKIQQRFMHFKKINDVALPKRLKGKLRDYQKAGYNWLHFLREFSFGGCLADDMGLGKTVQILSLLLYCKEKGSRTPSLIVVPTSLVFNWVNEVKKFTPFLKPYVHHGQDRLKVLSKIMKKKPDLIITTYGTLRNDAAIFKKKKFHYIVLDESQQIKNPLSKNAKSVFSLKSKYRLVLTGTPVENNALELWSQFAFLNPGLLGSIDYFRNTFTKSIEKNKDKDKIAALKSMINPFLLSRKKEKVAKELPEKQITVVYCEMEDRQRKIYDFWKEKYRYEIQNSIQERGFMQSRMKILQGLMKLRQICNHPVLIDESFVGESGKFNLLIDQIKEVISEDHKVLIFSSFVKMLHVFKDYFTRQNIRFSYLDGSTKNRKQVVEEFQQDSEIKVFLISLKAGGLGLNLTAADYVFIVDPWWNPAAEMQAIDRTHRIGQTKNVFVYKAITKDSVEEKILELQESKLDLVKNIITIEEGIFKRLNHEDVNGIFR